jgi:succinyl-diaminopimelate desuccinylase
LLVFAGHSDVVPPGPEAAWTSPPFVATEREGFLYGRGAVDMKGSLAAMVVAAEQFLAEQPQPKGSLAFLITSDEEGASTHGTKKVIEALSARGEKITYCLIGEPSSENFLGDQIRVGRRGSLHGKLIVYGKQSHIAYPSPGQNPIHNCLIALQQLTTTVWDSGNAFFPPTTFQISNLHAGTGALNVTPGQLEVYFNFRFSTAVTVQQLQAAVQQILEKQGFAFDLQWDLSDEPFLTKQGKLIAAAQAAIHEVTSLHPVLSTGGGTSDGRFIAPTGAEVVELGLCHATAHQADEKVALSHLQQLPAIYTRILKKLL